MNDNTMTININAFEMPEEAKVTKVFEKLMRINTVTTENGLREVYTERHDQYSETYGIGF